MIRQKDIRSKQEHWFLNWCTSWLIGWISLPVFIGVGIAAHFVRLEGWESVIRLTAEWSFGAYLAWATFVTRQRHRPRALFREVRGSLFIGICAAGGTGAATIFQSLARHFSGLQPDQVFLWANALIDLIISLTRAAFLARVGRGDRDEMLRKQVTWRDVVALLSSLAILGGIGIAGVCLVTIWTFTGHAPEWFNHYGSWLITSTFQALSASGQSLMNRIFERRHRGQPPVSFYAQLLRWAHSYLATAPVAVASYFLGNAVGASIGKHDLVLQLFYQQLFGQTGRMLRSITLANAGAYPLRENIALVLGAMWDVVRRHPDPRASEPIAPQGSPSELRMELIQRLERSLEFFSRSLSTEEAARSVVEALNPEMRAEVYRLLASASSQPDAGIEGTEPGSDSPGA
jgi:hypothetical protein